MNHLVITPHWRCARIWLLGAVAALIVLAVVARAEPAMWVIRNKDSTIYLIGTLHLLRHDTEWNAAKVRKAVAESSELWLEVADIDNQASVAPLIAQYGIDPEKPLSSKLNTAQKGRLAKLAATYGVPLASLEPMKPWMAALMFATSCRCWPAPTVFRCNSRSAGSKWSVIEGDRALLCRAGSLTPPQGSD